MKLKAALIIVLIAVFSLLGLGTWGLVNHYETKLSNQEIVHKNALEKQRNSAEERFNKQVELAKETEDDYKVQISELESKARALADLNSDLDRTIDGLRKSERDLRTRFDKLSAEAKREYAFVATEAFGAVVEALRREQLACQDLSVKAEQYWYGWNALDKSWDLPVETKVKEVSNGQ